MTREQITAFLDRRLESWRSHDATALASDHSEDGILESPLAGGSTHGREAIERIYDSFFHAFPDVSMTQKETLIDGDRVVLLGHFSGTDRGGFMGLAPTGRSFELSIVSLYKLADGLIVHERRIYDFTGLLVQVGAIKAKPV